MNSNEVVHYFQDKLSKIQTQPATIDSQPFLAGFTWGQFLTLSETEQARIWDEAHLVAEKTVAQQD